MKNYEILEHKADLKIKASGQTKEELFFNMMLGMEESMKPETEDTETTRRIKIESLDLSSLMVDFLSEVLYLIQINKEIYKNIEFGKLTDTEAEGELTGLKVERFGEDIKAVTHHNLDIHQNQDKTWEATVLFDI
ncbi:MAG: archease [Candidatus Pacebacteria bacterium]|nr:archease [Candidatus Paceibacterota bacterium]